MSRELTLLPPDCLVKTGPVDYAEWNYSKSILSRIQRRRFQMAKSLLGEQRYGKLLEIGYGSGIFMPELAARCDRLYGLDIHEHSGEVTHALSTQGIIAELTTASAEEMPYEDQFFDCIVAVSALDFVPDIARAAREAHRILAPGGHFIVVMPAVSAIVDLGLYLLTGNSAKEDFGDRREKVAPALRQYFKIEKSLNFPPMLRPRLYQAWRMIK